MKTYIMLTLCAITSGSSHHTFAMDKDDPKEKAYTFMDIQALNPINDDDTPLEYPKNTEITNRLNRLRASYKKVRDVNTIKD